MKFIFFYGVALSFIGLFYCHVLDNSVHSSFESILIPSNNYKIHQVWNTFNDFFNKRIKIIEQILSGIFLDDYNYIQNPNDIYPENLSTRKVENNGLKKFVKRDTQINNHTNFQNLSTESIMLMNTVPNITEINIITDKYPIQTKLNVPIIITQNKTDPSASNEIIRNKTNPSVSNEIIQSKTDPSASNEIIQSKTDSSASNEIIQSKTDSSISNDTTQSKTGPSTSNDTTLNKIDQKISTDTTEIKMEPSLNLNKTTTNSSDLSSITSLTIVNHSKQNANIDQDTKENTLLSSDSNSNGLMIFFLLVLFGVVLGLFILYERQQSRVRNACYQVRVICRNNEETPV